MKLRSMVFLLIIFAVSPFFKQEKCVQQVVVGSARHAALILMAQKYQPVEGAGANMVFLTTYRGELYEVDTVKKTVTKIDIDLPTWEDEKKGDDQI